MTTIDGAAPIPGSWGRGTTTGPDSVGIVTVIVVPSVVTE
jgi:hypothetical protein